MPNKNWEKQLAMELTHSEQGFYDRNLEFVRKIISNIRLQDQKELMTVINNAMFDSNSVDNVKKAVKNYYK